MAKKIKVTFDVYVNEDEVTNFAYFLEDLLKTSTLPALSAELVPLTLTATNKRVK